MILNPAALLVGSDSRLVLCKRFDRVDRINYQNRNRCTDNILSSRGIPRMTFCPKTDIFMFVVLINCDLNHGLSVDLFNLNSRILLSVAVFLVVACLRFVFVNDNFFCFAVSKYRRFYRRTFNNRITDLQPVVAHCKNREESGNCVPPITLR